MGDDVPQYETLAEEDAARRARAPKKGMPWWFWVGTTVVTVIVLAWAGSQEDSGDGSEEPSQTEAEEHSDFACDHFRNVAAEADLLTNDELRDKLQEVYDNSAIATVSVQSAARSMLSSITSGDLESFELAVTAMSGACSDAGH